MKLGRIQSDLVAYLNRRGEVGAFIGPTTACDELAGYDLSQVERALDGLLRRGVVKQVGHNGRVVLADLDAHLKLR